MGSWPLAQARLLILLELWLVLRAPSVCALVSASVVAAVSDASQKWMWGEVSDTASVITWKPVVRNSKQVIFAYLNLVSKLEQQRRIMGLRKLAT